MISVESELSLLGKKVEDKVTNAKGIVTSISFDLYGCVGALVRQTVNADGKEPESYWFDTKRLVVLNHIPVMELPEFVDVPKNEVKVPGPERRPVPR